MAVNGLAIGLSWEDMRTMKFTNMIQLMWAWDDLHGAEEDETRDATSSDVKALMAL